MRDVGDCRLGFVFGGLDFSRRDLMAVNIQRGRDHGLPDYNTAREHFGLEKITDWTQINPTRCGNSSDLSGDNISDDCQVRGGGFKNNHMYNLIEPVITPQ